MDKLKEELYKRKDEPLIKFLLEKIKERNECIEQQQTWIETMSEGICNH